MLGEYVSEHFVVRAAIFSDWLVYSLTAQLNVIPCCYHDFLIFFADF